MSNPFGPSPNQPYGGPPYGPPQPPPHYPPPHYPPQGYSPAGPPLYGKPIPEGTVKNWLLESILALVFCGGLLAVPAIIFAAQVDGHLRQGNYQAAVDASEKAKMWLMIAVIATVAFFCFCSLPMCVLYILAAIAGAA